MKKQHNLANLKLNNLANHYKLPWIDSSSQSWLISSFVTRVPQRAQVVEKELLTLPWHMRATPAPILPGLSCPIISFLISVL
jgi:hypothetical protein